MANNLAAFNATAWAKSLILNLDQINVMRALVNRAYEGVLANIGDTVYVRTAGSVTLAPYSKTVAITYQDLTPVKEAMTVADAEYFAFEVDDLEKAQNDLDAMSIYTKRAAVGMNNTVEAKLLGNYASAITANRITGASSAAIALDSTNVYGYFVQARGVLSKQNVPMIGRWAVVDPDTVGLLLQSSQFIRATDLGDRVVQEGTVQGGGRPGFIGRIAGFDVFESNAVPVASGAKYLQFGDDQAISYAAQIVEMEVLRLQGQFATAVRGLLLHDCKVFAENAKRLAYIKAVA